MYIICGVVLTAVLRIRIRIRIHRIQVFLGLLDPDPLVRGMDPDPDLDPSNIKKNLDFSCFVTSFYIILRNYDVMTS